MGILLNLVYILVIGISLTIGIFLFSYLRKRCVKKLKIELIDVIAVAFIVSIWFFVTGKITSLELASLKIESIKENAIEEIRKEIEKQREISMLWSKGTAAYSSRNYEYAIGVFEEILKYEPDNIDALEYCGHSLLEYAYRTCSESKKPEVLLEANRIWMRLIKINEFKYASELACVFCLQDNEEQCKFWLQKADKAKTLLPKTSHLYNMLLEYSQKDWFKSLTWKEE
jgi:tetratricopeptide (TPR) repeat protein